MPKVDPESLLRGAGMRVTRPRLTVLRVVADHPHADAHTITARARRELGSVSTQAIYDVLHALTDARLLRRIEPAGSSARYETRVSDNHHHLICRTCGVVVDVNCAMGEAPCLEVDNSHGFVVEEAEVTYWGTCPTCAARPSNT